MSPEAKNGALRRITTNEKVWRPLAAVAVSSALWIGNDKESQETEWFNEAALSPHEVKLSSSGLTRLEIELEREQIPIGPIDSPLTEEQIGSYVTRSFEEGQKIAMAVHEELVRKAEEERMIAERERLAEEAKRKQAFLPAPNPGVAAAEVRGGTSTKHISGYYCEYDGGFRGDGGGFCNTMSNGEKPYNGAAACGPSYPFGTVFYIEGYGNVVCKDRGGGISDSRIDVFSQTSSGLSSIPQGPRTVIEGGQ